MTPEKYLEFLRYAVDSSTVAPSGFSPEDWEKAFKMSGKQSLLGVTFRVLDSIPRKQGPALGIYAKWALYAEKLAGTNRQHIATAAKIYESFVSDGKRACVLKGQGTGRYYPDPLSRQCGDIDIWMDGSREETLAYFKDFSPKDIVYHHFDPEGFADVPVEVHFTPTWMNGAILNRRLQEWFVSQADAQFSNYEPELGFAVPTPAFDAVFSLVHIFRHVMDEGIGFRQLMDYYYILNALPGSERPEVVRTLKSLSLGRFTAAVMFVLKEAFGLGEEKFLLPADRRYGAFLLDEVLISGNFGRYDARNAHSRCETRVGKTLRKFRRQMRFFGLCPREVVSAPFFKLWQYLWRKRNNYL